MATYIPAIDDEVILDQPYCKFSGKVSKITKICDGGWYWIEFEDLNQDKGKRKWYAKREWLLKKE